ncbi:uncharacterized protein LOC141613713 [Silene latifolia]|uniref:uncharacterized protein LOC141613713 n=1 Tax=Silene latifolia TaxID=37657 RepID=UPI003D77887F
MNLLVPVLGHRGNSVLVKNTSKEAYTQGSWISEEDKYIIAKGYIWLNQVDNCKVEWYKTVWNRLNIPRPNFIMWLISQERLLTLDTLNKMGITIQVNCFLCGNNIETHKHLFQECCCVKECYEKLFDWLHIQNPGLVSAEARSLCYFPPAKLIQQVKACNRMRLMARKLGQIKQEDVSWCKHGERRLFHEEFRDKAPAGYSESSPIIIDSSDEDDDNDDDAYDRALSIYDSVLATEAEESAKNKFMKRPYVAPSSSQKKQKYEARPAPGHKAVDCPQKPKAETPKVEALKAGRVFVMSRAEVDANPDVRRWLELLKDYKIELLYHEGRAKDFDVGSDDGLRFHGRWCVPSCEVLKCKILKEAHSTPYSVHPGGDKMYKDLKLKFWWPGMKKEIAEFVSRCLVCQKVKFEHQRPDGLLQPLEIPTWKWDSISMDFVMGLPRSSRGMNVIWVVVDRLTKVAHFIPMKETWSLEELANAYQREIIRLHGVPKDIISDRDPRFCSQFWKKLQLALGSELKMSTAFHAATDGQTERTIQTLEDMLRACALEFHVCWEKSLPLVEFSYNNSYQASIQMAPFEALYGRTCRSPLCWDDSSEAVVLGPEFVQESIEQVRLIREKLKAAEDRQKTYADSRRKPIEFEVGDKVFLKVSPMKGVKRFGLKGKLSPKYIGPYEVLERVGEVAYRLALPPNLSKVHDVFHVSQLRRYRGDPSHVLQADVVEVEPNLTYEERPIRILERQEKRLRNKVVPLVRVLWRSQKFEQETWETEASMREKHPHLFE